MEKGVSLNKIDTKEQLSDIFTKELPRPQFEYLRNRDIKLCVSMYVGVRTFIWSFSTGIGNQFYGRNYIFGRWKQVHGLICGLRRVWIFQMRGEVLDSGRAEQSFGEGFCYCLHVRKTQRSNHDKIFLSDWYWWSRGGSQSILLILHLDLHRFS